MTPLDTFAKEHGSPIRIDDWYLFQDGAWMDSRYVSQPPSQDPFVNLSDRAKYAKLRLAEGEEALIQLQRANAGQGPPLTWHKGLGPPPDPADVLRHLQDLVATRKQALDLIVAEFEALPGQHKQRAFPSTI